MDSNFFKEVYCPNWLGQIGTLSTKTLEEPWRFKLPIPTVKNPDTYILEYYLLTVYRLLMMDYEAAPSENEADSVLCKRNDYACFHTGLLTSRMTPIYCFLERNRVPGYEQSHMLRAFCDEGSQYMRRVEVLPQKPFSYIQTEQLSFFPNWPIRFDFQMLFENDKSRDAISSSLLDKPDFPFKLRVATSMAIEKASQIPGLVVPHVMGGELKFMIPISFGDPNDLARADFAMSLDIMGGYYIGTCFLDTRQAYARTRVFGRPVTPWLTALVA